MRASIWIKTRSTPLRKLPPIKRKKKTKIKKRKRGKRRIRGVLIIGLKVV